MTLYEFPPTRSIRARWTLQELGVPFEAVRVNLVAGEHRRPEFLRINPAGKVPVLVDGDRDAELTGRVPCPRTREGADQAGVERAEAVRLAGPFRPAQQGEQRERHIPPHGHAGASPAAAARAGTARWSSPPRP